MNSEQKWVGWAGNGLGSGRVDPSQIDPISDFLGDQSSSGWAYLWFTPSAHLTGQDDLSFPFLKKRKPKPPSFSPFFPIFSYFGAHAHRFLFYKHSVVFVTWTHSGHVYST